MPSTFSLHPFPTTPEVKYLLIPLDLTNDEGLVGRIVAAERTVEHDRVVHVDLLDGRSIDWEEIV